jgi:hypothetical protein
MTQDDLKIKLRKKYEKQIKANRYNCALWLANVEITFKKYNYNLGYKRGINKKPRKNRPAVSVDKLNKNGDLTVVFLTTKAGLYPIFFIDFCQYQTCQKKFKWEKEAKIFSNYRKGKKPRKYFIINEKNI